MPRGVSSALVSGTSPWESPVEELWNTNHIPASWSRREEQRDEAKKKKQLSNKSSGFRHRADASECSGSAHVDNINYIQNLYGSARACNFTTWRYEAPTSTVSICLRYQCPLQSTSAHCAQSKWKIDKRPSSAYYNFYDISWQASINFFYWWITWKSLVFLA